MFTFARLKTAKSASQWSLSSKEAKLQVLWIRSRRTVDMVHQASSASMDAVTVGWPKQPRGSETRIDKIPTEVCVSVSVCVCARSRVFVLSLLWRLSYTHISGHLKGLGWVWLPWECLEALTLGRPSCLRCQVNNTHTHTHTHTRTHTHTQTHEQGRTLLMEEFLFPEGEKSQLLTLAPLTVQPRWLRPFEEVGGLRAKLHDLTTGWYY